MSIEKALIQYLHSKEHSWAEQTKRSVLSRLFAHAEQITGDPKVLWRSFEEKKMQPYSRLTTWQYVSSFWDFYTGGEEENPYRVWKKENARVFKYAYRRAPIDMSFEEAKARIHLIADESIRAKALVLLYSGMRYDESTRLNGGYVIGKGNKPRRVYLPADELLKAPPYEGGKSKFYHVLKAEAGLSPHQLRKIRATDLARRGMDMSTLCEVFGWNNLNTAQSYLAPLNADKTSKFFQNEDDGQYRNAQINRKRLSK